MAGGGGESDRPILIAALRTEPVHVMGSVTLRCEECGAEVGVAPSGQRLIREQNAHLICVPCGARKVAEDPSPEFQPMSADQAAEILGHFRRN